MTINFQEKFPEKYNNSSYYCSICGEWIEKGDFVHKCPESILKEIDEDREEVFAETEKNFGEKLEDADFMLNYYEEEEDEDS